MSSIPTKILFLDIDGVLNSHRTAYAFDGFPHSFGPECMAKFDHVAIGLVRKVCEETGASIVLSSSWRIIHKVHACANGLNLPIFDSTPTGGQLRGDEIGMWLRDHPEVTHYAIVDDDTDMLDEQLPRFVHTNTQDGLTFAHYEKLKSLLSGCARRRAGGIQDQKGATDGR